MAFHRGAWPTLGAALLAAHALAQEPFPSRTLRVIVPFTPGSVTDVMGRSVSDKLAANLGQPVIVENRPGAGGTQFGSVGSSAAQSAIRDGRLIALAVSGKKRAPNLPEVPTVAEAGVPGAEFNFWIGVLAPGQTPRPIIHKLHAEFDRALQSPDVRDRHAKLGADPMPVSPQQVDTHMRGELPTLGALLRAAGVKAN